jgi:hypothetical protein
MIEDVADGKTVLVTVASGATLIYVIGPTFFALG